MSQFIQLHLLTSYPPANLNRDDLGRPKTARMGGFERLRVSSQSLKRHWRVSDLFQSALDGHMGIRTKRLGIDIYRQLLDDGVKEKQAKEWTEEIVAVFGKNSKKEAFCTEQLVHISQNERAATFALAKRLAIEQRKPQASELLLLTHEETAVDIALFGRMLASSPRFNVEAACQVAHSISVHSVVIEDDYFTAIDDLNNGKEDSGSAHIGESGFASALFYSYICINKTLLIENLGNNESLANRAIQALAEAAVKISPTGKQNSFASRAYANYALAEKGDYQPRSLSVAFLKPIEDEDIESAAVEALEKQIENFDKVYGPCAEKRYHFNATTGEGSFATLADFISK